MSVLFIDTGLVAVLTVILTVYKLSSVMLYTLGDFNFRCLESLSVFAQRFH